MLAVCVGAYRAHCFRVSGTCPASYSSTKAGSAMKILDSLRALTARACQTCASPIGPDEPHYIEFPRDLYCLTCAKAHPSYFR